MLAVMDRGPGWGGHAPRAIVSAHVAAIRAQRLEVDAGIDQAKEGPVLCGELIDHGEGGVPPRVKGGWGLEQGVKIPDERWVGLGPLVDEHDVVVPQDRIAMDQGGALLPDRTLFQEVGDDQDLALFNARLKIRVSRELPDVLLTVVGRVGIRLGGFELHEHDARVNRVHSGASSGRAVHTERERPWQACVDTWYTMCRRTPAINLSDVACTRPLLQW